MSILGRIITTNAKNIGSFILITGKIRMKVKVWPLVLILLCFWLVPALTLVYLMIGMVVKIGHIMLKGDGGKGKEPIFHSVFGLMVEVYYILTWPRYLKDVGYRGATKIISGSLLAVSVLVGVFYYLGSTTSVPDTVTDDYKAVLLKSEHPLSLPAREELNNRIEEGFDYSDLLWARAEILKSCGSQKQPESLINRFTSTLKIGLFRLVPVFATGVIEVENTAVVLDCDVTEIRR